VEEPLRSTSTVLVATTMRTPGHDFSWRPGSATVSLLDGAPVLRCCYCGTGSAVESEFNVVSVDTGGRRRRPGPA
jgi:FdhD protein